ncbi:MAG: methyltransferase domain-containing protein [Candidatus Aenigmarchaeota archaeon]|nr:methyltransferase domain-containing protein [Candidatus Aenigmarchaeota archaeon]
MNEIWLLLIFFFSFSLYYVLKNRLAIFFPSSKKIIEVVLDFSDIKKNDVFYDLGSGDGRILIEAAKKNIKVIGVEQNKFLNWIARRKMERLKLKNVEIIEGDIFNQDLSKATVIVAYLSISVAHRLQKKIEKEVKKGTRIILVDHSFKEWKSVKMKKIGFIPVRLYLK